MGQYEAIGPDKSAEEILRDFGNTQYHTGFPQVTSYVVSVAQVRSANEAIQAQTASTGQIVTAVGALNQSTIQAIQSQHACTAQLVSAVGKLTTSIDQASKDSGNLGRKIVYLTLALVGVGLIQAFTTAWPFLSYWWQHR